AAMIQNSFFQSGTESWNGIGAVFFGIFVRIALVEEASRFLILIPLLNIFNRRLSVPGVASAAGAAVGLVVGLGFAALENASYGTADINITMLRAFTAAPLHGACGSRVGSSLVLFRERPIQALTRFLSAVIIHGTYNFMLLIPGVLPPIAAVLISLTALASSVVTIRSGMRGEKI
ncbi:MAG: PrsW family intramembrane metalloprotease, partial [Treponema sp.]|nr:PrsW family intramembrane metalloprotease [Treponema sp.]